MLFQVLTIWLVIVYSLRVALLGNPLANTLREVDESFLAHLDEVAGHSDAYTDESFHFLRRFARLSLVELGAFLLETGLLIHFLVRGTSVTLCAVLLLKNAAMFATSLYLAQRRRRKVGGSFMSLKGLPEWIHWWDRGSSLLSGLGFGVLFVRVNGWM